MQRRSSGGIRPPPHPPQQPRHHNAGDGDVEIHGFHGDFQFSAVSKGTLQFKLYDLFGSVKSTGNTFAFILTIAKLLQGKLLTKFVLEVKRAYGSKVPTY